MRYIFVLVFLLAAPAMSYALTSAPPPRQTGVADVSSPTAATNAELEQRVRELERRFPIYTGTGGIAFLYGVICALWASNSGRNAWIWFFFGLLLSIIAALAMLYLNGRDRQAQTSAL